LQGRISRRIAAAAIFAALYAILRLIPISPLIGVKSTLTLGEIFSPLTGIILGPFAGGISILIGTYLTVLFGRPLVFSGLDFIPGVIAAITAGLAINRGIRWSVYLSLILFAIFTLDPLSPKLIYIGQLAIPFLWMHILSVVTILTITSLKRRTNGFAIDQILIAAIIFISTMNAHVAGGIMFQNVLVRMTGSISPSALPDLWNIIFLVYPIERLFFIIVGSALAIPVLKTIPKQTLAMLRGQSKKQL
jgi:hypothetical protein